MGIQINKKGLSWFLSQIAPFLKGLIDRLLKKKGGKK